MLINTEKHKTEHRNTHQLNRCGNLCSNLCNSVSNKGQILIELIIATAIASVIISSVIGLFVDISQAQFNSLKQTQAEEYVQEAVNALYSIHERSWNDLVYHTYPARIINNNGVWNLADGVENIDDNFTRSISIESVYRNAVSGEISESGIEDPSTKKFIISVSWQKPRNLSISKEIYLTRYQNNANWIETTYNDFIDGTVNDTEVTNDQGGEIKLAYGQGEGKQVGNRFSVFGTSQTDALDNSSKKVSFRFTAQNTKEVRALRIYISSTHQNQTPTYRYGLQSDNNGSPSGNWLGGNNEGYKDFQTNNTGWHELNLNENVSITAGNIYHLVIEHNSGQINAGRSIIFRTLNPLNLVVPLTSADDLNLMIRWTSNGGANWSDVNNTPVYILLFTDSNPEAEGNPYHEARDKDVYGNFYKGEIFTYKEGTEFFNRMAIYVKKSVGAQPQDDLYLVIEDMTTNTILFNEIFVTRTDITMDYQLHEISLDPKIAFIEGRQYRFYLKSPGTAHNRSYHIEHAENLDRSPDNDINYLGLDARYTESNNAGTNWNVFNNQDTMFRLSAIAETGYFPSGQYISSTFDAGDEVSFNRIFWTELIDPGVTNVEFQIATNTDNATWNFVGPDGTEATRFTNPDGEAIPLSHSLGRYIKYKIYLTTLENSKTPVVYDVSVNYSP